MTGNLWIQHILAILPEILIASGACAILLFDLFIPVGRKHELAYLVALPTLLAAGIASSWLIHASFNAFGGMFLLDPFSTFFKFMLYAAGVLTILLSPRYLDLERIHLGEYYAFLLFAICGMMVMVSGGDLIMIYLGLELMAISLYVLAGFKRYEDRSVEAAAKYFILGSFSSAILLYAISILYGLSGTTSLRGIGVFLRGAPALENPALLLAIVLLVVGFGFKVSAVPFHMWTPDVYEGSPTPVAAFLSVGSKAASFAVFLRVFLEALGVAQPRWRVLLIVLAVATMALGNIAAIAQSNIKRMLAYSGIAHAGYALIGLIVGGSAGAFSLMLYLMIYTFMNLGAFGVVILMSREGVRGENIGDLAGLATRSPLVAAVMLVFMFSLTGIPPTAGFIAKFYIFMAAVEADLVWLAVVGVLFSAVSAFYYLRIIMLMYMKEPEGETTFAPSPAAIVALTTAGVVILALGVYPGPLVQYAQSALLP